jgi:PncC family amidohydrolase
MLGGDSLLVAARNVVEKYTHAGVTFALAESCTGGMVSAAITSVPGASRCFLGGVVAYANTAKVDLLQVPQETLNRHGAVSEAAARAMAEGARQGFHAFCAGSITGIAGPEGGTAEKPVGLVFLATADARETIVRQCFFQGDRHTIRQAAAEELLRMLLLRLP